MAAALAAREAWDVVLRYEGESEGPWIIDLSHRSRWDFQDGAVESHLPLGMTVPSAPGDVLVGAGLMINRMNQTQV